jgi:hypothetical protein
MAYLRTTLARTRTIWAATGAAHHLVAAAGVAIVATMFAMTVGASDSGNFLDVRAKDECDPATFAALCFGPHTGNVTLQEFLDALPNGGHEEWKFNPGIKSNTVNRGGIVQLESRAGERHTFTRVEQFGGGFVPPLNVAVGDAPTTPECAAAATAPDSATSVNVTQASIKRFAAGNSALLPRGTSRYQCCIHPWMRTTITVR